MTSRIAFLLALVGTTGCGGMIEQRAPLVLPEVSPPEAHPSTRVIAPKDAELACARRSDLDPGRITARSDCRGDLGPGTYYLRVGAPNEGNVFQLVAPRTRSARVDLTMPSTGNVVASTFVNVGGATTVLGLSTLGAAGVSATRLLDDPWEKHDPELDRHFAIAGATILATGVAVAAVSYLVMAHVGTGHVQMRAR